MGQPGTKINYSTGDTLKHLAELGYEVVENNFDPSGQSPEFDNDSSITQVYTVVMKHKVNGGQSTVPVSFTGNIGGNTSTTNNMQTGLNSQPNSNLIALGNTKQSVTEGAGIGTSGNVSGQNELPQTGNNEAKAASAMAFGLMGVALIGLGATKRRHN